MGRIRSIKPDLLEDEKAGKLDDATWRLFVSTWLIADDYGNLRGDSGWLACQVFWSREVSASLCRGVEKSIEKLIQLGMFRKYSVRGQTYLSIINWKKHQKVDHPGNPHVPSEEEAEKTEFANYSRDFRETFATDQDQDQDQEKEAPSDSRSRTLANHSCPTPVAPAIEIPTTKADEPFGVTEAQIVEWQEAFPAVDVQQALRNARQWCLANRDKRKTPKGVHRFLVRWLTKDQDKGGSTRATSSNARPEFVPPPYWKKFEKEPDEESDVAAI